MKKKLSAVYNKLSYLKKIFLLPGFIKGKPSKGKIFKAAKKELEKGRAILIQTDTVIGIAADATKEGSLALINSIKKAPPDKPRQIILSSVEDIPKYAKITPKLISKLSKLLPGPFTFILDVNPDSPLARDIKKFKKVGIRVPYAPTLLEFIKFYNKPLVASSANIVGKQNIIDIKDLEPEIKKHVTIYIPELKADLKRNFVRDSNGVYLASGVIDLTGSRINIIRHHPANEKALRVLKQ